jgi:hypothetical protein
MEVYQLILAGDLKFPSHFSRACMDLCTKLLAQNQSKRLGNMKDGVKDIIKHKWFSGFDWDGLLGRKLKPPICPVIKSKGDASNFDDYPEETTKPAACPEWDVSSAYSCLLACLSACAARTRAGARTIHASRVVLPLLRSARLSHSLTPFSLPITLSSSLPTR